MENNDRYILAKSILLSAIIISVAWVYTVKLKSGSVSSPDKNISSDGYVDDLEEKVLPSTGATLPVKWGDLGKKLVSTGVIDREKFSALYSERGGLSQDELAYLNETVNQDMVMTSYNAPFLLNLFWALALGNESDTLKKGLMSDSRYGGAGNFASTGGWTLASGEAMQHYARHPFITLTPDQQKRVDLVASDIYRPCCDNPTNFPDCNHGMAMLGLLELMASQGVSESDMYRTALEVNAFWFPQEYLTIAGFFQKRGVEWESVNPKEVLGSNYSSASGYRRILSQVQPPEKKSSGGCGV